MDLRQNLIAAAAAVGVLLPTAAPALAPAGAWEIGPFIKGRNYSVGMPSRPEPVGGAVAFEFPRAGGEIDALTTAVGPLDGARAITLRYRIDAARGTRFVPAEAPDQTATVSLYLQRAGDNWTARGRYASYRWYVPARAVMPIRPGEYTVTVRLDESWTNVNGKSRAEDPLGFADALDDTATIGIAFGTGSARSHGVYATGPGRFTLLGLDIR